VSHQTYCPLVNSATKPLVSATKSNTPCCRRADTHGTGQRFLWLGVASNSINHPLASHNNTTPVLIKTNCATKARQIGSISAFLVPSCTLFAFEADKYTPLMTKIYKAARAFENFATITRPSSAGTQIPTLIITNATTINRCAITNKCSCLGNPSPCSKRILFPSRHCYK